MMTIIVMAALFSLINNDRQATRCRNTLTDDWSDDIYDIFHSYRSAVDKQIDSELDAKQTQSYTISVMKTEQPQVINNFNISGNYIAQQNIDIHDNPHATIYASGHNAKESTDAEEDMPVAPTPAFFCTERFTPDIIEKNIRQAINEAKSKADACRKIMQLDTCGYITLKNQTDERKAELINPFAMPKYTLTGDDFRKARNR